MSLPASPNTLGHVNGTGTVSAVRIALAFFRLGSTAFGGPAMVAYIGELAVRKNHWLSEESFQDGVALCQTIPGATAMQTAAYVGLRAGGPWGALAAFAGFGLPAFVLMIALSAVYETGRDLQAVLSLSHGLRVIVVALIANATVAFGRGTLRNWRDGLLAAGAAVFLVFHGNPIWAIAAAAGFGAGLFRGVASPEARAGSPARQDSPHPLRLPLVLLLAVVAALAALFCLDLRLFNLAAIMAKVDLFAFGGGFASLPLMLHEVVDVRRWLDHRTFMDGIALGQVTPGPIVITATFVGYQVAGLLGATVGTLAVFSPSFLMVLAAVPYFDRLKQSAVLQRSLRGIWASFVGLLLAVAVQFGVSVSWSVPAVILAVAAFAALRLKADILWVVLAGGGLSLLIL